VTITEFILTTQKSSEPSRCDRLSSGCKVIELRWQRF